MSGLLIITDGRKECLERTLLGLTKNLVGGIDHFLLVNDSGDEEYRHYLDNALPEFEMIHHVTRRGFAGAIQSGWKAMLERRVEWCLHVEDDFLLERPVNLENMVDVLIFHPHLVQMALRRQPVNEIEMAAGGVVEQWPDEYTENEWDGHHWLEHRLFFTTNVSVYSAEIMRLGWPSGAGSEAEFSRRVFKDPNRCSAFWGKRSDSPIINHIGVRQGEGY